ncbi:MAG: hypothetical protein IJX85_04750 [Lachnospiraceae bacterium]|nr:hypothetical protein [Lachnospiraceae bacterium]
MTMEIKRTTNMEERMMDVMNYSNNDNREIIKNMEEMIMENRMNKRMKKNMITRMEEKTMNKMVKMMNKGREKLSATFDNICREEIGASELVVLVALIVIVLAIIIIFRTQLANIVTAVGAKVINWINAN